MPWLGSLDGASTTAPAASANNTALARSAGLIRRLNMLAAMTMAGLLCSRRRRSWRR